MPVIKSNQNFSSSWFLCPRFDCIVFLNRNRSKFKRLQKTHLALKVAYTHIQTTGSHIRIWKNKMIHQDGYVAFGKENGIRNKRPKKNERKNKNSNPPLLF